MTPATATKVSGFAGLATAVTGQLGGIVSGFRQGRVARKLLDSAVNEAAARIQAGEVIRQNSIRNAFLALQDATDTEQVAQERIDAVFFEGARFSGSIRAAAAASGVDPDVGSPLLAQLDAAIETGRAADIERHLADTRIRGFRFEAESFLQRGAQAARGAKRVADALLERAAFEAQAEKIKGRAQIFQSLGGLIKITQSKTFKSLLKRKQG